MKTRKKGSRKPREGEKGFLERASDADSALEDSSSGGEASDSEEEQQEDTAPASPCSLVTVLADLEQEVGAGLTWVAGQLEEEAVDREEEDGEDVPLVPLQQEVAQVFTDPRVVKVLEAAGLMKPGGSHGAIVKYQIH